MLKSTEGLNSELHLGKPEAVWDGDDRRVVDRALAERSCDPAIVSRVSFVSEWFQRYPAEFFSTKLP